MVILHIDLPIFSSPTESFGHFSGSLRLPSMPQKDQRFPWPVDWLHQFGELFEEQSSQVWTITEWPDPPPKLYLTMFGLVCRDRAHARELVGHIERCSGIVFNDHDLA